MVQAVQTHQVQVSVFMSLMVGHEVNEARMGVDAIFANYNLDDDDSGSIG